jgi:hypothetical protein
VAPQAVLGTALGDILDVDLENEMRAELGEALSAELGCVVLGDGETLGSSLGKGYAQKKAWHLLSSLAKC